MSVVSGFGLSTMTSEEWRKPSDHRRMKRSPVCGTHTSFLFSTKPVIASVDHTAMICSGTPQGLLVGTWLRTDGELLRVKHAV